MKENLEEFTGTITDKYPSSYADANVIFEAVLKYLNEAKAYYDYKNFSYVHLSLILDISLAYKVLTFYVNQTDKLKLNTQRLEVLSATIETMILEGEPTLPILVEAIICINNVFNGIYENVQSDEQGLTYEEVTTEISVLISKVIKDIIQLCQMFNSQTLKNE